MKRISVLLAIAASTAVSAVTVAEAQSHPTAHPSSAATVSLRHTSLGSILVNSAGRTLYEFTRDHAGRSSCASIRGCSEIWPSLKAARPTAGSGIKALLLSSRGGQVTYAGHPLYTYSADRGPGKTAYVGVDEFGGAWYALNAAGAAVK